MAKRMEIGFPPKSSVPQRRSFKRIVHCEIRCEKCLGKLARCQKCEAEVQAFLKAIGKA